MRRIRRQRRADLRVRPAPAGRTVDASRWSGTSPGGATERRAAVACLTPTARGSSRREADQLQRVVPCRASAALLGVNDNDPTSARTQRAGGYETQGCDRRRRRNLRTNSSLDAGEPRLDVVLSACRRSMPRRAPRRVASTIIEITDEPSSGPHIALGSPMICIAALGENCARRHTRPTFGAITITLHFRVCGRARCRVATGSRRSSTTAASSRCATAAARRARGRLRRSRSRRRRAGRRSGRSSPGPRRTARGTGDLDAHSRRPGGVEILEPAEDAAEDHDAALPLREGTRAPRSAARLSARPPAARASPSATCPSIW